MSKREQEAIQVVETKDMVEVHAHMPGKQRLILLAGAVLPLVAPYALVIRPHWQNHFSITFWLATAVAAGALIVGLFMLYASIAGLSSRARFDRYAASFTYSVTSLIGKSCHKYPFDAISGMHIEEQIWSDGPPSYHLLLTLKDGGAFRIGASDVKSEVEAIRQKLCWLVHN